MLIFPPFLLLRVARSASKTAAPPLSFLTGDFFSFFSFGVLLFVCLFVYFGIVLEYSACSFVPLRLVLVLFGGNSWDMEIDG